MGTITFNIVSGLPPFTAELIPSVVPSLTDLSLGQHTFLDVPDGTYDLLVTDSMGCEFYINSIETEDCILCCSPTNVFQYAVSSIVVGGVMFIGERKTNPYIVRFADPDNLTSYSLQTVSNVEGLESVCYSSYTGKIYFGARDSFTGNLAIIELNPVTLAYTKHVISGISGNSCLITIGGTFIYGANPTTFFKIRISDWTDTTHNHGGMYDIGAVGVDTVRQELYVADSGNDEEENISNVSIVKTYDLSNYSVIDISSFVSSPSGLVSYNGIVAVAGQAPVMSYGAAVIDIDDTVVTGMLLMPSNGLWLDGSKVYSANILEQIDVFDIGNPSLVESSFIELDFIPSEILFVSGRVFLTKWGDLSESKLCEFVCLPDVTTTTTSSTSSTSTTTSTTTICIRPPTIQIAFIRSWYMSGYGWTYFDEYTPEDVCNEFLTYTALPYTFGSVTYFEGEMEAFAVGNQVYEGYGDSSCNCLPEGTYWVGTSLPSTPDGFTVHEWDCVYIAEVKQELDGDGQCIRSWLDSITLCCNVPTTTTTSTTAEPTTTTTSTTEEPTTTTSTTTEEPTTTTTTTVCVRSCSTKFRLYNELYYNEGGSLNIINMSIEDACEALWTNCETLTVGGVVGVLAEGCNEPPQYGDTIWNGWYTNNCDVVPAGVYIYGDYDCPEECFYLVEIDENGIVVGVLICCPPTTTTTSTTLEPTTTTTTTGESTTTTTSTTVEPTTTTTTTCEDCTTTTTTTGEPTTTTTSTTVEPSTTTTTTTEPPTTTTTTTVCDGGIDILEISFPTTTTTSSTTAYCVPPTASPDSSRDVYRPECEVGYNLIPFDFYGFVCNEGGTIANIRIDYIPLIGQLLYNDIQVTNGQIIPVIGETVFEYSLVYYTDALIEEDYQAMIVYSVDCDDCGTYSSTSTLTFDVKTCITTTTTTTLFPPSTTTTTSSSTSSTTTTTTTGETTTTTTTEYVGCVDYGYLYNYYAINDVRGIANSGWHVPTWSEVLTLIQYLDPSGTAYSNIAGGILKETGTTHWLTPNTGATDDFEFSFRGAGFRSTNGVFTGLTQQGYLGTSSTTAHYIAWYNGVGLVYSTGYAYYGVSLRLLKNDSVLEIYEGNDGKKYETVKIGSQVWMAENLIETKYANNDDIPYVSDNTEWKDLTSGALCAYNNDCDYVGCGELCPTTTTTTTVCERPVCLQEAFIAAWWSESVWHTISTETPEEACAMFDEYKYREEFGDEIVSYWEAEFEAMSIGEIAYRNYNSDDCDERVPDGVYWYNSSLDIYPTASDVKALECIYMVTVESGIITDISDACCPTTTTSTTEEQTTTTSTTSEPTTTTTTTPEPTTTTTTTNAPPISYDNNMNVYRSETCISENLELLVVDFPYMDIDGGDLINVQIVTVPVIGTLQYHGNPLVGGEELVVEFGTDFEYELRYFANDAITGYYETNFTFRVKTEYCDDYSNTSTITLNVFDCGITTSTTTSTSSTTTTSTTQPSCGECDSTFYLYKQLYSSNDFRLITNIPTNNNYDDFILKPISSQAHVYETCPGIPENTSWPDGDIYYELHFITDVASEWGYILRFQRYSHNGALLEEGGNVYNFTGNYETGHVVLSGNVSCTWTGGNSTDRLGLYIELISWSHSTFRLCNSYVYTSFINFDVCSTTTSSTTIPNYPIAINSEIEIERTACSPYVETYITPDDFNYNYSTPVRKIRIVSLEGMTHAPYLLKDDDNYIEEGTELDVVAGNFAFGVYYAWDVEAQPPYEDYFTFQVLCYGNDNWSNVATFTIDVSACPPPEANVRMINVSLSQTQNPNCQIYTGTLRVTTEGELNYATVGFYLDFLGVGDPSGGEELGWVQQGERRKTTLNIGGVSYVQEGEGLIGTFMMSYLPGTTDIPFTLVHVNDNWSYPRFVSPFRVYLVEGTIPLYEPISNVTNNTTHVANVNGITTTFLKITGPVKGDRTSSGEVFWYYIERDPAYTYTTANGYKDITINELFSTGGYDDERSFVELWWQGTSSPYYNYLNSVYGDGDSVQSQIKTVTDYHPSYTRYYIRNESGVSADFEFRLRGYLYCEAFVNLNTTLDSLIVNKHILSLKPQSYSGGSAYFLDYVLYNVKIIPGNILLESTNIFQFKIKAHVFGNPGNRIFIQLVPDIGSSTNILLSDNQEWTVLFYNDISQIWSTDFRFVIAAYPQSFTLDEFNIQTKTYMGISGMAESSQLLSRIYLNSNINKQKSDITTYTPNYIEILPVSSNITTVPALYPTYFGYYGASINPPV